MTLIRAKQELLIVINRIVGIEISKDFLDKYEPETFACSFISLAMLTKFEKKILVQDLNAKTLATSDNPSSDLSSTSDFEGNGLEVKGIFFGFLRKIFGMVWQGHHKIRFKLAKM